MVTTMTFVFNINLFVLIVIKGVSGLQVEELWSLDAEEFKNLG